MRHFYVKEKNLKITTIRRLETKMLPFIAGNTIKNNVMNSLTLNYPHLHGIKLPPINITTNNWEKPKILLQENYFYKRERRSFYVPF